MKVHGKGIAAGIYPTAGMVGGRPVEAIVEVCPDGQVNVIVGSVDMGQGSNTIMGQIAAQELGLRPDQVTVLHRVAEEGPFCGGSFGSRLTYHTGNATLLAARAARQMLCEAASYELEEKPDALELRDGSIFVRGQSDPAMRLADAAARSSAQGRPVLGHGEFAYEATASPFPALAWSAVVAEVDVDTDTGEVVVTQLTAGYDVGKALNPLLIEGQIEGGASMAVGAALMEQLYPFYPVETGRPATFGEYMLPTAVDMPDVASVIYECPAPDGPYGAKGFCEMAANTPVPAIVNAVNNALGVQIAELPITPERVLRALAGEPDDAAAVAESPLRLC